MRQRAIAIVLALLALLGGLGIWAYYREQDARYVSTDNARVMADLVPVAPEISGRLLALRVRPGDRVQAGAVLGEVSTEALAQTAQANPQALPQAAPIVARRALLLAPISGTVVQTGASVGQLVGAGQAVLYLADLDQAYVSANVDEGSVHRLRLGDRVEVWVDALPGRVLSGVVEEIGEAAASTFSLLPDTNASTGNFTKVTQVIPVRVGLLEKPPIPLGPGMSARVRFYVAEPPLPVRGETLKAVGQSQPVHLKVAGSLVGDSVTVVSEVSGTVRQVRVRTGDRVEEGQVLAVLENRAMEAQLRAGQAAVRQAQGALQQAELAYAQAQRTYARVAALYEVGAASRQDLENARTQRDAAYLQYQAARVAVLPQAQSNLEALGVQVGKLTLRSPLRGWVASRQVDPGQVVGPGQPLFALVGEGDLRFEALLPAQEVAWVRPGDPAQVDLPGVGTFLGEVRAVAAAAIPIGGYFPVSIRLKGEGLRPGLQGVATLQVQAQGVALPRTALRWMAGQAYAFLVEGGHLRRIPVEVLHAEGDQVLVQGLAPGAEVVAQAQEAWEGAPLAR